MERFLVTGGAGFIGSHLVDRLVAEGREVTVLDDLSSGSLTNLSRVRERIRFIEGSVNDPASCREAMRDAAYVLHHAALVSVQESMQHPDRASAVNAEGTRTLLEAAHAAGVRRFVYASTSAYYGDDPALPKVETMPANPISPYALSKAAGEAHCADSHRRGLETVVLRYFNVFGSRQNAESSYAAVVPRFIAAAIANEAPTIYGDGEQTRDFIHVHNVVDANLLACRVPGVSGMAFNIGSGERISLNGLWWQITQMTGCTSIPRHAAARAGDIRDSVCSTALAEALLGFRLRVSLASGLAATIAEQRPPRRAGSAVA